MPEDHSSPASAGPAINRRQVLGAVGAAAGVLTLARPAAAAPAAENKCFVRVAAVSYTPPFHDHRREGVNLAALREMTAKVMHDRPDFICYPEVCSCIANGFEKGIESAPELEPYFAEVGKIAREFNVALVAPFIERQGTRFFNSAPIVDRRGNLVLVYRKNYPTIGELEAGISPGRDIPVGDCDGVRVGAAVCFDANFDNVAAELERQKAQLVFWPSMYWGGSLLQHWALRYGFSIAVAYVAESAVIDMTGRFLDRRGTDSLKVRQNLQPPWAVAQININRELYHLDDNQLRFPAMREKYGPDVEIEVFEPEGYFLMSTRRPDLPVATVASEFRLETLRDYLARSVKLRNERLPDDRH
ncbi:MAG: carbon-nitrogen hydrolase family protein [Planctomycetaceae bacterium]|nr:carbon-nitrogen hydrolase family protein [Planctomycetaceae bacterium]